MNIVEGTKIKVTESVFTGSYRNPKYAGNRTYIGTVVKDSYGNKKGQHTFTIEVESVEGVKANELKDRKIRRKGRNVYKDCEVISYPANYEVVALDKEDRAKKAKIRKYHSFVHEYLGGKEEKLSKVPLRFIKENYPEIHEDIKKGSILP